jgi:hypothetical protein
VWRLVALLALAAALAAPLPAAADGASELGLDATDRRAIHDVIAAQMEAFKKDDGETAFSFASPTIRTMFGTAANFMNMVKSGYHPVYRPKTVSFGEIVNVRGEPVQKVFVLGENGVGLVAAYVMQRQPDSAWKINGVYLFQDDSKGT